MKRFSGKRGSVLMETVLVMPLLLSVVMGALQFAHIHIAKQIVGYAAFSAARAVLSAKESGEQRAAEEAARRILSWLILPPNGEINGVLMPDYAGVDMKSHLIKVDVKTQADWIKTVEIQFAFPLDFPVAAQIIRWGMNIPAYDFTRNAASSQGIDLSLAGNNGPHLVLTERCALPKPYIIHDLEKDLKNNGAKWFRF